MSIKVPQTMAEYAIIGNFYLYLLNTENAGIIGLDSSSKIVNDAVYSSNLCKAPVIHGFCQKSLGYAGD